MPKLPALQLTDAELAIANRYQSEIGFLENLLAVKRRALSDILGLALEARGFSPTSHEVQANGRIVPRASADAHP